jgi:copper chaperone NosL
MIYKIIYISLFLLTIVFSSCSTEPEPINFGTDQCENCKMTIADNKFGSELITNKGKVYKFDAVECMINYTNVGKIMKQDVGKYLVINTAKPGELIDAVKAVYLRSENFPSPMGEYLSAYGSREEAAQFYDKYQGEYLTWDKLSSTINSR